MVAMSNNYWDDENELDTQITGNESETDLQKKLRQKIRADEKRIKELEEKVSGFTKVERERTVKEILDKEGVNPKAARLALKDIEGDITPEAVLNWLDDNGELFGYSPVQGAPSEVSADRDAMRKQDAVTQGALTPDRGMDLEMRIDQASSPEELARILYSQ
jgi:hypothetical protein